MTRTAVFPATFDPVTNGHVNIASRAAQLFERLVVGVYEHDDESIKDTLFSVGDRVRLVRAAMGDIPGVEVKPYRGLTVAFAQAEGAAAIVRGLRVADDFEFERQMAMMNRHLAPEVESLLLISEPNHAFVSASLVRQVARMGGDVRQFVPAAVAEALRQYRSELRELSGRTADQGRQGEGNP